MHTRLSYANVAATLALFFAMSGGALAAKHYLINSTKQINPKVLKGLKGKQGPAGPTGKEGQSGKEGPAGKDGKEGKAGPTVLGAITEVRSEEKLVGKGLVGEVVAKCPKGSRAISGGAFYEIGETQKGPNTFRSEATKDRTGWVLEVGNPSANTESMFEEAVAYCAKEGEAVAP